MSRHHVPEGLRLLPGIPERVKHGHTITPAVRCPYCEAVCYPAETVDIGVGHQQVEPHGCEACGAVECAPHQLEELQGDERRFGWFRGPGPSLADDYPCATCRSFADNFSPRTRPTPAEPFHPDCPEHT